MYPTYGCTDSTKKYYDPSATIDAGCEELIYGCMVDSALNYDSTATDNEGCVFGIPGCTDTAAYNYLQTATEDDGSFTFPAEDFDRLPRGTPGVTWMRRFGYGWTEPVAPDPGLWVVGARELGWTVEIEEEEPEDDDVPDPNGG